MLEHGKGQMPMLFSKQIFIKMIKMPFYLLKVMINKLVILQNSLEKHVYV